MKYKTAFRLAVRLVGVLVLATWLPRLLLYVGTYAFRFLWEPGVPGLEPWVLEQFLSCALSVAFGCYLFFYGQWIVDKAIPSNRPYCHECAYELTGLPLEGVCPECGTSYRGAPQRSESAM